MLPRIRKAFKWVSKPHRRRVALAVGGWLVGKFLCAALPVQYQAPCNALAQLGSLFQ